MQNPSPISLKDIWSKSGGSRVENKPSILHSLMKNVENPSEQTLSTNMTLGYDSLIILAQKIEETGRG